MKKPVNTTCIVCGQAEGKPCECVTAHKIVTGHKPRRKGYTQYETSYSNVERHADSVCDGCAKKQRLADLKRAGICLAVSVALMIIFILVINASNAKANLSGSNTLGLWGSLAVLALIPDSILAVVSLVHLLSCLRGDYGSRALGAYYVRKHRELYPQDSGYIYMTLKKARSEHLVD